MRAHTFLKVSIALFTILFAAGLLFSAVPSVTAQTTPTITSDLVDYQPGAAVTLTGAGWQPGEAVHLFVNDNIGQTWNINADVVASDGTSGAEAGTFTYQFQLPTWFVASYSVTATGAVSGTATTSFTDSAASLAQCTNGTVGPPIVPEPCVGSNAAAVSGFKNWENGNANGSKSHWNEGEFISYRVNINGIAAGSHTLVFDYSPVKSNGHAIDYLGSFDATEKTSTTASALNANNNNPCADLVADGIMDPAWCPSATGVSVVPVSTTPIASADLAGANAANCGATGTFTGSQLPGTVDLFGPSGATITNFKYLSQNVSSGSGACTTTVSVDFNLPSALSANQNIVIAWGGHIASQINWGAGNSASSISGSPYHMALDTLDGASQGSQDRALQNSGVIPPSTITVIKNTTGGDDTFGYSTTGGGNLPASFNITTSGGTGQQVFLDIVPGTYSVNETTLPTGWTFTGLTCTASGTGTSVTTSTTTANIIVGQAGGGNITCTYSNRKAGAIKIIKNTVGGDATFAYTTTGGDGFPGSFNITTSSGTGSQTYTNITPGAYSVAETALSGWAQTGATCDSGTPASFTVVAGGTVTCTFTNTRSGQDLTVSKTAAASYTRTYTWGISKAVDNTTLDIASGGTATFHYTVDVTHDSGTDSAWAVKGTITVNNPNDYAVTGVSVSDTNNDGGTCTVDNSGAIASIAANGSAQLGYTCTYALAPSPASGTNTATATWDAAANFTPHGSATGTAAFTFGDPTTVVDGSVTVTDTLGGSLGTVTYTDPTPKTFTYSHDFTGDPAGTCTGHDNTATFKTNTTQTTGSDGKTVTVCVGADLTVVKTAATTFTRTFTWGITKDVDQTKIDVAGGTNATFRYTVDVTHDAGVDSAWQAAGTITITNPNDWEDIAANVADTVNNGGTCTVYDGANPVTNPVTVGKSATKQLTYTCTYASAPAPLAGTNTITVSWDKVAYFTPDASNTGTAAVNFATPTTIVDGSVTVTDPQANHPTLGTLSYTDLSPVEFVYTIAFPGVGGTCTDYNNTATFTTNTTGTTGSASKTVTVCAGLDLTVVKTAAPTFTRTYAWTIAKAVDKTTLTVAAGGDAVFNYTVNVTHDSGTDSAWFAKGTITISNPNDWEAITASVADTTNDGGTCTLDNNVTSVTVPASGSVPVTYTCTFASAPNPASGTNTATVTWDKAVFFTPTNTATNTANFDFATNPTTIVDGSVTVTDTLGGSLGTVSYTDPSPKTFTYSHTFTGDPSGTCTTHNNTATFTTNTTGATGSASQTVTVCVAANLTVTKDAAPTFTRTFTWGISKDVDKTQINVAGNGSATFNYTVNVTHNAGADSAWQVTGTITVTNPNDFEDISATVSDAVDNGGSCTVTTSPLTVPKGGTASTGYTCAYASAPTKASGTNTATVTWNGNTATGTAAVDFSTPSTIVDGSVTVTDTQGGDLGTVSYTDPSPKSFTYPKSYPGVGGTCTDYNNTATFTTNTSGTTGSASQTVKVCAGLDLTATKTAAASFTRTYAWNIAKSVDKTTARLMNGTATFNYTVSVTHDTGTDSAWQVTGKITVANPNDWEDIVADVSDAVDDGGSCTVTPATVTVPKGGNATADYTCTYASAPTPLAGTNTATASWDKAAYSTPDASTTGTAAFDFNTVTPTIVLGTVTVKDDKTNPASPVTLGTVSYTDPSPKTFTYSLNFTVPAASCQSYTNTAKIVETGQPASTTVTVCKASVVTDTSLCTLANEQFKLVYTPDQASGWKLNASNPGQFYYNVFYTGPGNEDVTITLPYPFVTQGATPIHVYSNVGVTTSSGITCLTPSGELANQTDQVTLANYGAPYDFTKTTTVTVHVPALTNGFAYINIHLNYGLKGTTGYAKGGPSGNDAVRFTSQSTVLIKDQQPYKFNDTASGDPVITSTNSFKKDPGIGGLVLNSNTDPVANARIDIYLGTSKTPTGTIYTDADGWYMWQYKWTGKAASFNVKMTPPASLKQSSQTQTVTLKANGYLIVNFTVAYP